MTYKIAVLAGDGIGPEIMAVALNVLQEVERHSEVDFAVAYGLVGGAAYDEHDCHFPSKTEELCRASDAILFGSVGGPVEDSELPKWKNCEANSLLTIRKAFHFNANFRPARVYPELASISPLRDEVIKDGVDILFVRELLGDIYFGEHRTEGSGGNRRAIDVAEYSEEQIEAIAVRAFEAARSRDSRVTSVDKANVLDTSKLWREVVSDVQRGYPDVSLNHMLVDNCAMQLIRDPGQFDVVLTPNMFGDILSDAAAVLPGSLGLLPSASVSSNGFAMYEPSGGSAPELADRDIANPIAQVLCVAMMLRYSFEMDFEARLIESAVEQTLRAGYRTKDIHRDSNILVGTRAMGEQICMRLAAEPMKRRAIAGE